MFSEKSLGLAIIISIHTKTPLFSSKKVICWRSRKLYTPKKGPELKNVTFQEKRKKKEKSYHFTHQAQASTNTPSISTKEKNGDMRKKQSPTSEASNEIIKNRNKVKICQIKLNNYFLNSK